VKSGHTATTAELACHLLVRHQLLQPQPLNGTGLRTPTHHAPGRLLPRQHPNKPLRRSTVRTGKAAGRQPVGADQSCWRLPLTVEGGTRSPGLQGFGSTIAPKLGVLEVSRKQPQCITRPCMAGPHLKQARASTRDWPCDLSWQDTHPRLQEQAHMTGPWASRHSLMHALVQCASGTGQHSQTQKVQTEKKTERELTAWRDTRLSRPLTHT
jgi:hypothetical protein